MITIAVFAFAVYHPGYAFKDFFGALRGSSSASSEDTQKAEVVEMRPASAETHSCQANKLLQFEH